MNLNTTSPLRKTMTRTRQTSSQLIRRSAIQRFIFSSISMYHEARIRLGLGIYKIVRAIALYSLGFKWVQSVFEEMELIACYNLKKFALLFGWMMLWWFYSQFPPVTMIIDSVSSSWLMHLYPDSRIGIGLPHAKSGRDHIKHFRMQ